ncbi:hypothetical protein BE08_06055 [Sorangium cellulosum]|uniref:Molybdate ABC transporter substrate-binding protein n=1 Tax=Sorangium cellulosum TaxID=56 RepID=A0A150P2N0_SORCE|nr:hypothetical protein BE08_06055 [Sorangium cellulosum]
MLASCAQGSADGSAGPKIAAAANLSTAFEELGREHERMNGEKVTFVFGASGLLAKQIGEGAPFDAFYAADSTFTEALAKAGTCDAGSARVYARARIVLWTSERRADAAPRALGDLAEPRFVKIAIANPEHAPYGRAAREALRRSGVWERVATRMVYGENVNQALQFAQSGNADAAIVPLSTALSVKGGRYEVVDGSLYSPLEQTSIACKGGRNAEGARRFEGFLRSADGASILSRHGFIISE